MNLNNFKSIGYLSLALSLLLQVTGSLVLYQFKCNVITFMAITSVLSCIIFVLVSMGNLKKIVHVIYSDFGWVLLLNLSVLLMLLPFYFCIIHGLSPAIYILMFASVLGLLSRFENGNLWWLVFLTLIIIIFILQPASFYLYLSLLGPIGTYSTLKIATILKKRHGVTTSQLMVLRYALSALLALAMFHWLPDLSVAPMNTFFWSTLAFLLLGANVLPIFLSQYSSLALGYRTAAIGLATLPFFTFVGELCYLHIHHGRLMWLAVAIAFLVPISTCWPLLRCSKA